MGKKKDVRDVVGNDDLNGAVVVVQRHAPNGDLVCFLFEDHGRYRQGEMVVIPESNLKPKEVVL